MAAKLTIEQSEALHQSGDSLPMVDPKTERIYLLVDQSVHQQAMEALQRQRDDDMAAIQQGIDDMEAGRVMTLEESKARTEAALAKLK
jgi:predicted transcriptional regulator